MFNRHLTRDLLLASATAAAVLGLLGINPGKAQEPPVRARLSAAEEKEAIQAVDSLLTSPRQNLLSFTRSPTGRVREEAYPARVELLPTSNPGERLARVYYYRYRGDATILTTVDLKTKEVVGSPEVREHLPTPLAREELDNARKLAESKSDLVRKWRQEYGDKLVVEPLVHQPGGKKDPQFGTRVVNLIYRVGPSYFSTRINVNLTRKTVEEEKPQAQR